jgi:hypothetical protein
MWGVVLSVFITQTDLKALNIIALSTDRIPFSSRYHENNKNKTNRFIAEDFCFPDFGPWLNMRRLCSIFSAG